MTDRAHDEASADECGYTWIPGRMSGTHEHRCTTIGSHKDHFCVICSARVRNHPEGVPGAGTEPSTAVKLLRRVYLDAGEWSDEGLWDRIQEWAGTPEAGFVVPAPVDSSAAPRSGIYHDPILNVPTLVEPSRERPSAFPCENDAAHDSHIWTHADGREFRCLGNDAVPSPDETGTDECPTCGEKPGDGVLINWTAIEHRFDVVRNDEELASRLAKITPNTLKAIVACALMPFVAKPCPACSAPDDVGTDGYHDEMEALVAEYLATLEPNAETEREYILISQALDGFASWWTRRQSADVTTDVEDR